MGAMLARGGGVQNVAVAQVLLSSISQGSNSGFDLNFGKY